jgi:15-cis-phytoene synthase
LAVEDLRPASEIVRGSGSNLAFALAVLPRRKRRDMEVFYAFCRVVDDWADAPGLNEGERRVALNRWRGLVRGEVTPAAAGIETEFVEMVSRRQLPPAVLEAIITGVEMDLNPLRFETAADLRRYCYHVAGAVGLVSIELFGYHDPQTRVYAEELGYALQWTNILRDVGQDAREGRVFLPIEDLRRWGLSEADLLSGAPDKAKFERLMSDQTKVAREHYRAAKDALLRCDVRSMRSAELMRRIYTGILNKMEADGFQVFEKRYRLGKLRMLGEFLRAKAGV